MDLGRSCQQIVDSADGSFHPELVVSRHRPHAIACSTDALTASAPASCGVPKRHSELRVVGENHRTSKLLPCPHGHPKQGKSPSFARIPAQVFVHPSRGSGAFARPANRALAGTGRRGSTFKHWGHPSWRVEPVPAAAACRLIPGGFSVPPAGTALRIRRGLISYGRIAPSSRHVEPDAASPSN